jgi:hypothetical protein
MVEQRINENAKCKNNIPKFSSTGDDEAFFDFYFFSTSITFFLSAYEKVSRLRVTSCLKIRIIN